MKKIVLIILPLMLGWNTLIAQTPTGLTPVPASIVTDVPEAANYGIVYHLDIPLNSNYAATAINYAIDHASELNTNHDRVAYYMELDGEWVWVSMDDFASGNLPQLGIPRGQTNNVIWDASVSDMNIYSNKVGVTTGQNISTGNIEMWSECYNQGADSGLGGNGSTYDFDDTRSAGTNCYGSFQVHNNGAQQTLFGYNRFVHNSFQDLGIGNNPGSSGNPDWTFQQNSNTYTTRKLYILVGSNSCVTTGTDVQTACDSYMWIDGNTYTASNSTATHTLTNAASCDSIVTLNLTINNSTTSTDTQVACDTYTWVDGNTYTTNNTTATFTTTNVAGCDNVATLNLTINNSTTSTDTQVACDSYTWLDGVTYTSSNSTATFTSTNAAGCDNVATLNLTINNSTTSTDTQVACDSYTWLDGVTYTSSNSTATFTSTNAVGCDNVATLNLTINNSTTSTDTQVACDSYTWLDGVTYTSSNSTATFISTNAAGCDNVSTLNLTINNSTTSTDIQVATDMYTWIDGNTYTTNNTTATYTGATVNGCDSLITLNLIINTTTSGTDVQVACDSLVWIDGNTYTADNTTAMFTLVNMAGVDSVVTLNLTVNNSTTSTDTQVACDSYTWIDGNTYTMSNDVATHTLSNVTGCDSLIMLNLTINYSSASIDTQMACDSLIWIDGVTYTMSNSIATYTLTNMAGCDSIITLDLTITDIDVSTTESNLVISANNTTATSYQWINCNDNSLMVGETNTNLTVTQDGEYAVVITEGSCSDTSDCVMISGVGIDEELGLNVSIYPNPNKGEFTIQTLNGTGLVNIYTIDGKCIKELKITESNQLINLGDFERGVYFVKVIGVSSQKTIRLVVD
jgi:hypothetical protein